MSKRVLCSVCRQVHHNHMKKNIHTHTYTLFINNRIRQIRFNSNVSNARVSFNVCLVSTPGKWFRLTPPVTSTEFDHTRRYVFMKIHGVLMMNFYFSKHWKCTEWEIGSTCFIFFFETTKNTQNNNTTER